MIGDLARHRKGRGEARNRRSAIRSAEESVFRSTVQLRRGFTSAGCCRAFGPCDGPLQLVAPGVLARADVVGSVCAATGQPERCALSLGPETFESLIIRRATAPAPWHRQ